MRPALVTVCALFALLALAAPASARPLPAPAAPPPRGDDPRPHPALLAARAAVPLVIVRRGDTLSAIAAGPAAAAAFWTELWWANRGTVRNPDLIIPGERLRMPACRAVRPAHARAALEAIPAPPPPAPAAAAPASPPAGAAAPAAAASPGSAARHPVLFRRVRFRGVCHFPRVWWQSPGGQSV